MRCCKIFHGALKLNVTAFLSVASFAAAAAEEAATGKQYADMPVAASTLAPLVAAIGCTRTAAILCRAHILDRSRVGPFRA